MANGVAERIEGISGTNQANEGSREDCQRFSHPNDGGARRRQRSIFDFGESAKSLKFLRTETGLTINELRSFHGIAAIIGTTNEQLDQGFRKAKEILDQWQRWHTGPILDWAAKVHNMPGLGTQGAQELKDMAERIRIAGGGIRAEMKEIFAMVDKISSEPEKRNFLSTFGFDPNLARMSAAERSKYLAEAIGDLGKITDAQIEAGDEFDRAWNRLSNTMKGFKDSLDGGLVETFTHLTNDVREIAHVDGSGITKLINFFLATGATGLVAFAGGVADVAAALGKLTDNVSAMKVPDWTKNLPHALREGVLGKEGAAEAEDREKWFLEQQKKFQKQSFHGAGVGAGGGLIHADFRSGGGGDIGGGPESIIFRAVLRGSWQGSRQGVIDALHYLRDETSGRFGGVSPAAYHPGGTAGDGGLGGGYGGVGGGAGGALGGVGGTGGGVAVHGHGGQRSILGGSVHADAAAMREAVAGGPLFQSIIRAEGTGRKGNPYEEVLGYGNMESHQNL
jgi:hypothetical protein